MYNEHQIQGWGKICRGYTFFIHNCEILWYKERQVEREKDNSITYIQTNSFFGMTYIMNRETDVWLRDMKRKQAALVNQENGLLPRLVASEGSKRSINIRWKVCIMSFFSWLLCWPTYHVLFIMVFNLFMLHFFVSNMGMLIYATKSYWRANVRINNPWRLTQLSVPVLFVFGEGWTHSNC